ncbi:MAG TPA: hypothetical protein VMS76_15985, partial [Planctomycetota bacterium]|nr:hypothetical protein [Planctomycetota bacterium]
PDVLSTLVPAYLPAVPGTGWGRRPSFEYTNYNGRWRLWVDTYKFAAFDTFEYAPNRHHQGFGSPDRIGDWVYVHE